MRMEMVDEVEVGTDVCDICGRPVDNGDTLCRHCHKREDAHRRTLRLVRERKRQGAHYGKIQQV